MFSAKMFIKQHSSGASVGFGAAKHLVVYPYPRL
jgi:hypothetical protein